MATLAATAVVINDLILFGGPADKDFKQLQVTITANTHGTIANPMPATAFGLTKIISSSPLMASTNDECYYAVPSHDGTKLLPIDNTSTAPVDIVGTFRCIIVGRE